jgi:nucleoid DNA-binding protein
MSITRRDLVEQIASNTGRSKAAVDSMLVHFLQAMSSHLVAGQQMEIRGFCKFKRHWRKPHQAHNPRTGLVINVPGGWVIKFIPSKALKGKVNG